MAEKKAAGISRRQGQAGSAGSVSSCPYYNRKFDIIQLRNQAEKLQQTDPARREKHRKIWAALNQLLTK